MNFPSNLLYTKSHEWIQMLDGQTARVGLSDYAQSELSDVVFVNLPEVGDKVIKGERIADVESVKAVSDIFSPFNGTVRAINDIPMDSPEKINSDPYGTWLFEISHISEGEETMDAAEYEKFCQEGH